MEKSLLFILFCCMGFVAKAQTIEEIKILDANEIVPVCIFDAPTAYQNGTTINRVSGNLVGISINLCKSIQKELFINDTP